MRILIADDEPLARVRLRGLLARRTDVTIVGEVADGDAVLDACARLKPDVVLLDVDMPGLTGTAAARRLGALAAPPQIVFCTAYEQHALSAFDLGATDYLLKPVRAERLDEALGRVDARRAAARPERPAYLRARSGGDEVRVALDDVLYLLADEKYVAVHHGGGMWLIDESLRQLETAHGERLVRLHRNCLVPRERLVGLKTLADGRVLARLAGTDVTPEVSRRNLPAVRQLLRTPDA